LCATNTAHARAARHSDTHARHFEELVIRDAALDALDGLGLAIRPRLCKNVRQQRWMQNMFATGVRMQPAPLSPKRAYEIDELVQQGLGSRSYIYAEINAGALRAVKRGRRTIILEQDLATWLSALPAYRPGHKPR
jgi:hypothetical protein